MIVCGNAAKILLKIVGSLLQDFASIGNFVAWIQLACFGCRMKHRVDETITAFTALNRSGKNIKKVIRKVAE